MCEYCDKNNKRTDGQGDWIVYYDAKEECYKLYTEQFRNEYSEFKVKYCPECGRNLENKYFKLVFKQYKNDEWKMYTHFYKDEQAFRNNLEIMSQNPRFLILEYD